MSVTKLLGLPVMATALLTSSIADAGSWRNNGQETDIGGLDTFVYVPTSAPALEGKRALMVSMHGCSQPNDDFKTGAGWPPVADQYGMVIALPQAAGEGSYGWLGCWNFHTGMNSSRNSSDQKYLIDMVNELLADSSLNIDPNQVYLTGLSSGAGMTNQMGCLAPDVFAGVGVNAGPAPGSDGASGDLSNPAISVSKGESNCETLSNKNGYNNKAHLYTQLHNEVHGTEDGSVSPAHADRNADIAVAVYNDDTSISQCGTGTISGAQSGNHGDLTEWCDSDGPRVSKILVNGMGHAWPAGDNSSGGGNYIDHNHINYPEWITAWFFENNRRVTGEPPVQQDSDGDGVPDSSDNCPNVSNPNQEDSNNNGIGDACESSSNDADGDGIEDDVDNCPNDANSNQADNDNDGVGNVCDPTPNGEAECTDYTANNVAHVTAGRAYAAWGLTYALGSNDYMGLYNAFTTKTLKKVGTNHYELGSCP